MFAQEFLSPAAAVLDRCRDMGFTLVTAESCTGGLIAGCLTEIAGSSDVLDRGFVTYSNQAKMAVLGVTEDMFRENGAVSEQVARAMAEGALERSKADVAIAVTGIAGPGGGSEDKPVGLVHIACARKAHNTVHLRCSFGDQGRGKVRELTVLTALDLIMQQLGQSALA
ncbi:MAG: CinA family protein [Hyphomicrobiales bacterium]